MPSGNTAYTGSSGPRRRRRSLARPARQAAWSSEDRDRESPAPTDASAAAGPVCRPTRGRPRQVRVVYTEAMAVDHPEMVAARALGVPMMNYFDALGLVANEYYLIAVAGTHGKTTTTAMLADVLEEAGLDPTVIVGSLRSKTGSNFRPGKSKYAVVEACEYKRDFMSLRPDVLVITNVEYEHVDYYKDLADVQNAFHELALHVREGGVIVANTNDPALIPILANINNGHPMTVIDYRLYIDLNLKLRQPGMHNRMNAAAARGVAEFLKVETSTTNEALENFVH